MRSVDLQRAGCSLPCAGLRHNGRKLVNPADGSAAYFADVSTLSTIQPTSFAPTQGPLLEVDTPLNILAGGSDLVRVDNTATSAYLGSGNGSLPAEQFLAYDAANPNGTAPVKPGALAILKSRVGGLELAHMC